MHSKPASPPRPGDCWLSLRAASNRSSSSSEILSAMVRTGGKGVVRCISRGRHLTAWRWIAGPQVSEVSEVSEVSSDGAMSEISDWAQVCQSDGR